MKSIFIFIFLSCSMVNSWALTILIDPGHGGDDDGAKFGMIKEKDIALSISEKIYKKFSEKNFHVYLTRSLDRTVTLPERAAIADKTKADLFISVHINSSLKSEASGFETYYLDNHNDVAIKKVERTENILLKGDEVVVQQILIDLAIQQTVKISKPLALNVHSEIKNMVGKKYKIHSRGIRPGLFFVLALSKRPGILLEVGFMSNPKERQRMMNKNFQNDYAQAVVVGVEKFLKDQHH